MKSASAKSAVMPASVSKTETVISVDPARVRPFADQPREYFDKEKLASLETSIERRGQLQPGMVQEIDGDPEHEYELVDGQRRWTACVKLKIPFRCVVVDAVDVEDQFEISVASNFQRAGHTPPRDHVVAEIDRLGGKKLIMSTNIPVRGDGLPYANAPEPSDPGVAVYFEYKGKPMCFACDKFWKTRDNMRAIGKTIEAIRGIERWGSSDMMERAFKGFTAIPEMASQSWREVLEIPAHAKPTEDQIDAAYRMLAHIFHPDKGGNSEEFHRLTIARENATRTPSASDNERKPMFQTENISAYLKSIVLKKEASKRVASLRFFITPITHELAREASPVIADRLFNKNGSEHTPVLEMGKTEFLVKIPNQSMSYKRHPEYVGHDVLIPEVSIGAISAQKVIQGNPNFSLIFDAAFEITDKTVIPDLVDLFHEKLYLTFKPMQPGLFPQPGKYDDLLCRLCDAPNPEFIVKGSTKFAYCQECVDQREQGEEVERIRNSDQAAAIAQDMNGGPEPEKAKGVDPLLSGADINGKAAKRQRSKRVH